MYQCYQGSSLVTHVASGGGCRWWGGLCGCGVGSMWELHFCSKPKPALKNVFKAGLGLLQNWSSHVLVAQWLRIRLPVQETRVRSLVREDPTCRGAVKPVCHNYWACEPQLLSPRATTTEARAARARAPNKRSHCNEKPAHRNEESPLLATTRESLHAAAKTQRSQK